MKLVTAFVLSLYLVSCSGNNFTPGSSPTKEKGSKSQNSNPSSVTVPSVTETEQINVNPTGNNNTYTLPPGTAVIPVAVGGASLTCMQDIALGVLCMGDGSDIAKNFAPVVAWYATPQEKIWTPTTFTKKPGLSYLVKIPETILQSQTKVSIMLLNSDSLYMADMEAETPNLQNLVADPSFQNVTVDLKNIKTQIFEEHEQSNWKAYRPPGEDGTTISSCAALLAISSTAATPNFKGSDSDQWLELASPCTTTSQEKENLGVKQTLKTVKGHLYRVSFSYRNAPEAKAPHLLKLRWNGEVAASLNIANSDWLNFGNVFEATSDSTILAFEEASTAQDGKGTNLDGIIVIDYTLSEAYVP